MNEVLNNTCHGERKATKLAAISAKTVVLYDDGWRGTTWRRRRFPCSTFRRICGARRVVLPSLKPPAEVARRPFFGGTITWGANRTHIQLNSPACGIKDGDKASTCWWELHCATGRTDVEWVLLVDIAENLRGVSRLAVNSVVVVEPFVHWAKRMTSEKVGVHLVEHIFEIADLPISRSCTIWTASEAEVSCRSWPKEAFLDYVDRRGIMRLRRSHTCHIEVFKFRHRLCRYCAIYSQRYNVSANSGSVGLGIIAGQYSVL